MAAIQHPYDAAPEHRSAPAFVAGSGGRVRANGEGVPGLTTRVLRAPLTVKLLGANLLIAVAAIVVAVAAESRLGPHPDLLWLLGATLAVALVANVLLVSIALRPLRSLIESAERVRGGALDTRWSSSRVADRDLLRLGTTLNGLLDELVAERARLRELAAEVISAGDRERERIARELHDSTAQRVAALVLHLGAVLNDGSNERLRGRLTPAKQLADEVLEELRTMAHVMHPRVLHDLGLPHALNMLARETSTAASAVETDVELPPARLPIAVESVLYRVAQEAVSNALRHGEAGRVRVTLRSDRAGATLVVEDDGKGFRMEGPGRAQEGVGLFTMRERVALVDGAFEITSQPGAGTRVRATVPLGRTDRAA